jgi:phage tail P2-like protein
MEGWKMIKLSDAELISVLPPFLKENADMQAISYAFKKGMEKMLAYAGLSALYADIEGLPDEIVDLLALEFQSQYYDESMDLDVKRGIVKNSIAWYAKGGTVSAVDEMVQTVFGEGEVVEWYEYNGEPGTFYINTSTELSPDIIESFNEIIDKVKNIRSHLTNVKINREINSPRYAAVFNYRIPHIIVK